MARGIIFLKKTEWSLFDPSLTTIITTPYPATAVSTMDVVNSEELGNSIKTVFTSNKLLTPSTYAIILAKDILFTKEFTRFDLKPETPKPVSAEGSAPPPANNAPVLETPPSTPQMTVEQRETAKAAQAKEIATFIEHVPFEEVGSKVLTMPKSKLVVAANQELYMTYKSELKKLHHTVDLVLPELLFPDVHLENGFTTDSAKNTLMKIDTYRQDNLLPESVDSSPHLITNTPANPKKEKQRTIVLIGVFVLLFLFMIVLYFVMYMKPKPKHPANLRTVPPQISPVVTLSPTPEATSAASLTPSLSIQILSSTNTAGNATKLKSSLSSLGAKNINVSPGSTTPPKTLIIFSSDIQTTDREILLKEVEKISPTATSQESTATTKTVTITLGSE